MSVICDILSPDPIEEALAEIESRLEDAGVKQHGLDALLVDCRNFLTTLEVVYDEGAD